MKTHTTLFILLLIFCSSYASAQVVVFEYDAMGNRVKRFYDLTATSRAVSTITADSTAFQLPDSTVLTLDSETPVTENTDNDSDRTLSLANIEAILYPNPTVGQLSVSFSESVSGTIQVVHLNGSILSSQRIEDIQIHQMDVSHLPPAAYYVRFFNDEQVGVWEVLKF